MRAVHTRFTLTQQCKVDRQDVQPPVGTLFLPLLILWLVCDTRLFTPG